MVVPKFIHKIRDDGPKGLNHSSDDGWLGILRIGMPKCIVDEPVLAH